VFLVLSALLAMYHLLPVLEGSIGEGGSCWQAVLTYWRRRARRILPGYLLANVLIAVVFRTTPADLPLVARQARKAAHEGCPSGQATNLLFLTNTQSMMQACGAYTAHTAVLAAHHPCLLLTLLAILTITQALTFGPPLWQCTCTLPSRCCCVRCAHACLASAAASCSPWQPR
jgi:hypothetical protein